MFSILKNCSNFLISIQLLNISNKYKCTLDQVFKAKIIVNPI